MIILPPPDTALDQISTFCAIVVCQIRNAVSEGGVLAGTSSADFLIGSDAHDIIYGYQGKYIHGASKDDRRGGRVRRPSVDIGVLNACRLRLHQALTSSSALAPPTQSTVEARKTSSWVEEDRTRSMEKAAGIRSMAREEAISCTAERGKVVSQSVEESMRRLGWGSVLMERVFFLLFRLVKQIRSSVVPDQVCLTDAMVSLVVVVFFLGLFFFQNKRKKQKKKKKKKKKEKEKRGEGWRFPTALSVLFVCLAISSDTVIGEGGKDILQAGGQSNDKSIQGSFPH